MKIPSWLSRKPSSPVPTTGTFMPPDQKSKFKQEAIATIALFACAVLIVVAVKAFMVQPYVVDGESMETTLQNSDRLLVDKLPKTFASLTGHSYMPKRGDIIIFNQDNLPGFIGTKQLIKRVVGLPGERVVVNNGTLTIYNSTHPQGFDPDTTGQYKPADITPGDVDLTIGPNQLFVCGDNRPNSEDSRAFGPINASQIVGKLSFRIFPLGKLHHY